MHGASRADDTGASRARSWAWSASIPVSRSLPARVLRRTAPAHRHRPRARARARAPGARRAGLGARRLDPGADPRICCATCSATGLAYLFIAHDLAVVRHVSDRVAVMYLGRIVETGPRDAALWPAAASLHESLLSAVPVPNRRLERARAAHSALGEIGSGTAVPTGCRFIHAAFAPGWSRPTAAMPGKALRHEHARAQSCVRRDPGPGSDAEPATRSPATCHSEATHARPPTRSRDGEPP